MKTIILTVFAILFAFSVSATKAITGNSNTFLEDYELTKINKNLYELTYSNSTEKFTVEVCPEDDKCCYLVRGENVEIMYLCNELGFGIRRMPENSRKLTTQTYSNLINNRSLSYQSLLTPKQKTTKKALGLIACFFPEVINKESQILVFNPEQKKQNDSTLTFNK